MSDSASSYLPKPCIRRPNDLLAYRTDDRLQQFATRRQSWHFCLALFLQYCPALRILKREKRAIVLATTELPAVRSKIDLAITTTAN